MSHVSMTQTRMYTFFGNTIYTLLIFIYTVQCNNPSYNSRNVTNELFIEINAEVKVSQITLLKCELYSGGSNKH